MRDASPASHAAAGPIASAASARPPKPAVRVAGLLGAAVIGLTLGTVRLWARLTRTPYYDE